MSDDVIIMIPARYASSRFPGKPLAMLTGATGEAKTLIHRAWEAALEVEGVGAVYVLTDDERIAGAARGFGADVLLTPEDCENGTARCAAAVAALPEVSGGEIIVNLQGDAPLTPPWFVSALIAQMQADPSCTMATPVLRCDRPTLAALRNDRRHNRVGGTTAVFDHQNNALYFSKEVIPFTPEGIDTPPVFHHVGVYAYRLAALERYRTHPQGSLERLEGLEQLRFLEAGIKVKCVEVEARGREFWELNNPSDIPVIEAMMARMKLP